MLVTYDFLRSLGACSSWANGFRNAFPEGLDISQPDAWITLLEKGFGYWLDWGAEHLGAEYAPVIRDYTFTAIERGPHGHYVYLDSATVERVTFDDMFFDLFSLSGCSADDLKFVNCNFRNIRMESGMRGVEFINCTTDLYNSWGYEECKELGFKIPNGLKVTVATAY